MTYKYETTQDYLFTDIIEDSLIKEKNSNKYLIYDNDYYNILDLVLEDNPVIFYCPKWKESLLNQDLAFEPYAYNEETQENVLHEDIVAILPIYGYRHSMSSICAGYNRYHCAWDSGKIGYAYITKKDAKNFGFKCNSQGEFNTEELESFIVDTTDIIDKIYQGEVYTAVHETLDNNGNVIDHESISGLIGYFEAVEALNEYF